MTLQDIYAKMGEFGIAPASLHDWKIKANVDRLFKPAGIPSPVVDQRIKNGEEYTLIISWPNDDIYLLAEGYQSSYEDASPYEGGWKQVKPKTISVVEYEPVK